MNEVTVPLPALKHIINSIHTRYAEHTFMGGCECPECQILRCWPQDNYGEFAWLVSRLNEIRNCKVVCMEEAEYQQSQKIAPNFKIKI